MLLGEKAEPRAGDVEKTKNEKHLWSESKQVLLRLVSMSQ